MWVRLLACGILVSWTLPAESALEAASTPAGPHLVTMLGRQARLHTITEEIARQSGLVIACGKDEDDWPVRDLPVTIYAREYPAEKLLTALADAMHLHVARFRRGEGWSYRIYRAGERKRQYEALADYEVQCARWSWDWAAAMHAVAGPSPEHGREMDTQSAIGRELSLMLDALGQSNRDRVLEGETIVLGPDSRPAGAFAGFCKAWQQEMIRRWPETPAADLEAIAKAAIPIWREGGRILCSVLVPSADGVNRRLSEFNEDVPDMCRKALEQEASEPSLRQLNRPTRPAMTPVFELPLRPVDLQAGGSRGFLDKTVRLTWSLEREPTTADLLVELAKALDIALVCEDFRSNQQAQPQVEAQFGQSKTGRSVLKDLWDMRASAFVAYMHFTWYSDEKDRLLVGCNPNWADRHRALVPSAWMDYLRQRLTSDGAELEDLVFYCLHFTDEQKWNWFEPDPDLRTLKALYLGPYVAPWRIWETLSDSQKKRCASDDGFPLAETDLRSVQRMVRDERTQLWRSGRLDPTSQALLPTETEDLRKLTVRLVRDNGSSATSKPGGYALLFKRPGSDASDAIRAPGPATVPLRSEQTAKEASGASPTNREKARMSPAF